jgi:polar amino acid transport system substrate-binding protein
MKLLNSGKLVVATSPDYPPFENLENGEYVGLDIEIAKAVGKELGLEVEFKNLQFDAIIPAIAAGGQADMGISGFSVDPDRAKEIDFTDSYYIDDQAIAVMKGGAVTKDNAATELNKEGVIIAVQSGTTGESYVKENFPKATVQPYGNSTDAFAALQSGQANAVCTNLAVVEKMLKDAYQDAEIVKSIATGEEYAIVVNKDNAALKTAINDALAKLKADGTIDKLVQQYM